MDSESLTSRPLAPEDIRPDDYVAVLSCVAEYLPLFCIEDVQWMKVEPVRVAWMPPHGLQPMRVIDVCLPFILVRTIDGSHATLDVRRWRLARVSRRFGKKVFKRLTRDAHRAKIAQAAAED